MVRSAAGLLVPNEALRLLVPGSPGFECVCRASTQTRTAGCTAKTHIMMKGVPKWVYGGRLFIVSARTIKRHHHLRQQVRLDAPIPNDYVPDMTIPGLEGGGVVVGARGKRNGRCLRRHRFTRLQILRAQAPMFIPSKRIAFDEALFLQNFNSAY
jgi:hypothetical protein